MDGLPGSLGAPQTASGLADGCGPIGTPIGAGLGGGVVAGATAPVSGAHGRSVEVTEKRGNEV